MWRLIGQWWTVAWKIDSHNRIKAREVTEIQSFAIDAVTWTEHVCEMAMCYLRGRGSPSANKVLSQEVDTRIVKVKLLPKQKTGFCKKMGKFDMCWPGGLWRAYLEGIYAVDCIYKSRDPVHLGFFCLSLFKSFKMALKSVIPIIISRVQLIVSLPFVWHLLGFIDFRLIATGTIVVTRSIY